MGAGALFTILANALVAAVFLRAAFSPPPPILLNGAILGVLLVGVVYILLLRDLPSETRGDRIANSLLHYATPLLALLYWLACAPRGGLSWRAPLVWTAVALAYVLYAFARAAADGVYPYPFLNVAQLGAAQVLANCAIIGGGFTLAGFGLVALDRKLAGEPQLRGGIDAG